MRAPASAPSHTALLRQRLGTLGRRATTLGEVLDRVAELHQEMAEPGTGLRFETYGLTPSSVTVEVVFRWPHADELGATPERTRLCFDVAAGPRAREVEVGSRDYPHITAFVTAALEASELDREAWVTSLRVLPDKA